MAERYSISDAEEMKIARQIFNEVKRTPLLGQVVTTGREANYLRTLGQRIAESVKADLELPIAFITSRG